MLHQRVLFLVLLLTQVATTFAGPEFTLCISPKGCVCIDSVWDSCTCCQDDCYADQTCQTPGADDKANLTEQQCSCRCGYNDSSSAALTATSTYPASLDWNGQPCRCQHIPLLVTLDGQQPVIERVTLDGRQFLDSFVPIPSTSIVLFSATSRSTDAILPIPPPSGHLLAISCTIFRC